MLPSKSFRYSALRPSLGRPSFLAPASFALASIVLTSGAQAQTGTFRLDDLDLARVSTGYGSIQRGKSMDGNPITIGGQKFERGLGVHAPSVAYIALNGDGKRFQAQVGVDDEVSNEAATLEFRVIGDGKVLWKSGVLRAADGAKAVDVDLAGVKTLQLEVTDGGNGRDFDHGDWAEAQISYVGAAPYAARDPREIVIEAGKTIMVFAKSGDGHLLQKEFGSFVSPDQNNENEAYPAFGAESWLQAALKVTHADGNTSTDLRLVGQEVRKLDSNITLTRLDLKDLAYPFFVSLYFKAYANEGIIEQWSDIRHQETGPVTLYQFASAAPLLGRDDFYLTQYHGEWANEMNSVEEKLTPGLKTLSSRRGTQVHLGLSPSFLLAKGAPAQENSGEVLAGTLAYPGNFQMQFEVSPGQRLRAICGMNPEDSQYKLARGETFTTPAMVWGQSASGMGDVSRRFARWGRRYGMRDGNQTRAVLLNNWEATFFNFDEPKLVSLFDGAKDLGMELFLLDDGWFGNKYPRSTDNAGLGDWEVTKTKLPRGLSYLTDEAQKRGLRFGLWLEPEMVNPKSELFDKHPNWVIRQPKRELALGRNQLVLDLANPQVREWMYQTVHGILASNPGITYIKWDCNRTITQPGSTYLGPDRQTHLWIDYERALLNVFDRLARAHPKVEIMMCSSGGGRVDYGSLLYAQEVWPSDNTDPVARVRMQWSYNQFFPTNALSSHVTHGGGRPLKFAFDVAMSARLGMDMDTSKLSAEDKQFARDAIATYKGFRDVVQMGDLYRLETPYGGVRASQMSVAPDQSRAVLFAWQMNDAAPARLKLQGLDGGKRYLVRELNRKAGQSPQISEDGKILDGAALMRDGVSPTLNKRLDSTVVELIAQ
jgi:alpha-galactosidase